MKPTKQLVFKKAVVPDVRRMRYWPVERRFWIRVQKGPGCWEWMGLRDEHGYGRLRDGKGGFVGAHRLSNGRTRLTQAQVLAIRESYRARSQTMDAMARQYGVCNGTIQAVVYRRNWRRI